jgi:hypothetical protein
LHHTLDGGVGGGLDEFPGVLERFRDVIAAPVEEEFVAAFESNANTAYSLVGR